MSWLKRPNGCMAARGRSQLVFQLGDRARHLEAIVAESLARLAASSSRALRPPRDRVALPVQVLGAGADPPSQALDRRLRTAASRKLLSALALVRFRSGKHGGDVVAPAARQVHLPKPPHDDFSRRKTSRPATPLARRLPRRRGQRARNSRRRRRLSPCKSPESRQARRQAVEVAPRQRTRRLATRPAPKCRYAAQAAPTSGRCRRWPPASWPLPVPRSEVAINAPRPPRCDQLRPAPSTRTLRHIAIYCRNDAILKHQHRACGTRKPRESRFARS